MDSNRLPKQPLAWPSGLASRGMGCRINATAGTREARLLQFHAFDESYLERLCSGDFRTESHFVTYFSELIQLKLRSRVKSAHAVEDLRQETFARVFAALRGERKVRQA